MTAHRNHGEREHAESEPQPRRGGCTRRHRPVRCSATQPRQVRRTSVRSSAATTRPCVHCLLAVPSGPSMRTRCERRTKSATAEPVSASTCDARSLGAPAPTGRRSDNPEHCSDWPRATTRAGRHRQLRGSRRRQRRERAATRGQRDRRPLLGSQRRCRSPGHSSNRTGSLNPRRRVRHERLDAAVGETRVEETADEGYDRRSPATLQRTPFTHQAQVLRRLHRRRPRRTHRVVQGDPLERRECVLGARGPPGGRKCPEGERAEESHGEGRDPGDLAHCASSRIPS